MCRRHLIVFGVVDMSITKQSRGLAVAIMAAYLTIVPKVFPSQETKPEEKKAPFVVSKISLESTLASSSANTRVYAGVDLPFSLVYRSLNDFGYSKDGFSYSAKHDLRHKISGLLSANLSYYFVPNGKDEGKLGLHLEIPKNKVLEGFIQGLYDVKDSQNHIILGYLEHKFGEAGHISLFATSKPNKGTLYFELEAALRIKDDIYLFGQLCDSNSKEPMLRGGIKVNLVSK